MDDGKRKKKQNRFNSRVFKFSWPIETIAGNEYDIKFELWEINNVISYRFDLPYLLRGRNLFEEIRLDNFFLREGDFKREKKREKKVVKNGVSQPRSAVTAFKTAFALRMYICIYMCVCVCALIAALNHCETCTRFKIPVF